MGHIRLGNLPRTRKWIQVLDLIGGAPEVAAATMDASQRVLAMAAKECQIVIFTCVPDRYGNVGEATVVSLG